MMGKASTATEVAQARSSDHVRSLTTEQVLAYWRLTPSVIELRTRRLGMYQSWAKDPAHYSQ
eukprot:4889594-Pyramimonas_sp.AAC.1